MPLHPDAVNRIKYADPVDPWATVSTPWGELPAWKADALANGALSRLYETTKRVRAEFAAIRNDAAVLQEQTSELVAERRAINNATRRIVDFVENHIPRVDALLKRVEAHERRQCADQLRADQERHLAELLGDPVAPGTKEPEPALASEDDTHLLPGGELHSPTEAKQDPAEDVEQDTRGEFLRRRDTSPTVPPRLDLALIDVLQPRQPVAAGLD
jgi:hypothetical protein